MDTVNSHTHLRLGRGSLIDQPARVKGYIAEFEKRWRERTPSTRIDEVLPNTRVSRSEMQAWWVETYNRQWQLEDYEDVMPGMMKLFRRLRREFPDENW